MREMEYRKLSHGEEEISIIGLGTSLCAVRTLQSALPVSCGSGPPYGIHRRIFWEIKE